MARARRRWMREQGLFDPARLVFVDETAVSNNMARLRGRCKRGERLIAHIPQEPSADHHLCGWPAPRRDRGPFVLNGAMNGASFLAYLEQCLVPRLNVMTWLILSSTISRPITSPACANNKP